jgi:peptidylprolyl isomerase
VNRALGLVLAGVAACSSPAPEITPQAGALPADTLAQVGAQRISLSEVEGVMRAQDLAAPQALERLIRDELLARAVADDSALHAALFRRVLARQLSLALYAQAQATPPTREEVQRVVEARWWLFERPPSAQVTHAVVVCQSCAEPQLARQVAERVLQAVQGAHDVEAFKQRARAVDAQGLTLKVEDLPFVAADGRIVPQEPPPAGARAPGHLHVEFARAANALDELGELSPIVESPSGFHVLRLTALSPALHTTHAERVQRTSAEIFVERARRLEENVLSEARSRWPVEVSRSFAEDTELLMNRP